MSSGQKKLTSAKVLVTGGAGFVGANLIRHLLKLHCKVVALVRPETDLWRLEDIKNKIELLKIDLLDKAALDTAIKKIKPEVIFHLAAFGAYSWQTDAHKILETNITSMLNLLEAYEHVSDGVLIHAGSSSEYGYKSFAAKETTLVEPNSIYSVSKATATHLGQLYANKSGKAIATLRLYSVYGPYEDPGRLFPKLIVEGLKGRFPNLADPKIARDFVYVDDVCNAFLMAAVNPNKISGEIFNVGSGIQTSLSELVAVISDMLNIAEVPEWSSMPNRHWDTTHWVGDVSKIKKDLNWESTTSLKQGLDTFIDWYKDKNNLK